MGPAQEALVVKALPSNTGDARNTVSVPGSGRSPGGEMAAHSSILAWSVPRAEKPGRESPEGHKEPDMAQRLNAHSGR